MRNKSRIAVDAGMTLSLLFLMSYGLISEKVHEWIGILIFVLLSCTMYSTGSGSPPCRAAGITGCAQYRPFSPR